MKLTLILMATAAMSLNVCNNAKMPAAASQVQTNETAEKQVMKKDVPKKIKPMKVKFTGKKLHPEKQFCVTYKHTGMGMNGTSEMCLRKHGQETYTIDQFTIGMAGISQSQNKHTVIIKDKIYTSELGSGAWKVATNPMYVGLTKGNPEDLSNRMLAAMGLSKTGETETIAGTKCNSFSSAQMGSACFTKNMVMLRQSVMGMEQIATKVNIGSAGDAAKYARPKNATEAPDIGKIMEMMGKQK